MGRVGTNNLAEFLAIIIGMEKVKQLETYNEETRVLALLDSKIVVDTLNGQAFPKNKGI